MPILYTREVEAQKRKRPARSMMSHRLAPKRRVRANSRNEYLPRRAHRYNQNLRGGAPSAQFQTMVKLFRRELFFISGLHWGNPELGRYVKYFYKKLLSGKPHGGIKLTEDVNDHLKLAELVADGIPGAPTGIEQIFDDYVNKVDFRVHSHKHSKGAWRKADIWFHVKFLDDMQTMASSQHATTITIKCEAMPVAFYVTVDPNDPNDPYHYTLQVVYSKLDAGPNGEVLVTFSCTNGTRRRISEDGDMGPIEECTIDPVEVVISLKWHGPSDRFKKNI